MYRKIGIGLMGSVLALTTCSGNLWASSEEVQVAQNAPKASLSSQEYASAMAPGWNLGNTFDGFDTNGDKGEESWGNPKVTKELIHTIKEQGFNSIRIPFTTEMRIGGAPTYELDKAFLKRYAEVVNWALEEDLYVMVNIHHDSWVWAYNIGTEEAALEKYEAIWKQLADYFKDYPDKLCFEALNEPYFNGEEKVQIAINNQVNEAFYKIVRASGGKNQTRMLVFPTLQTNDAQNKCDAVYESITSLNDPYIMATCHYYGFWPFSVNIADTTSFDAQTKEELEAAFNRMYNTFTQNKIGVICGEYGLLGFDTSLDAVEHGEMLKYFEYINYYAKQKGITLMLWDNGQHMNRKNYEWSDPSLYDIIKSAGAERSSYTGTDRIFINKEKNEDVTLKLVLNGNTFKVLSDEKIDLKKDEDYTINKETLTIKGSYLDRLAKGAFGQKKVLKLKCSKGAEWAIYVNYYTQPKLSAAQGTTKALIIPMEFNGSRLITMEANYKDGSIAGPQNWTSYKQFAYTFAPDYEKNQLIIKDKFFEECKDGEINLKLHLQSGEIITYQLMKKGDTVTGTPSK